MITRNQEAYENPPEQRERVKAPISALLCAASPVIGYVVYIIIDEYHFLDQGELVRQIKASIIFFATLHLGLICGFISLYRRERWRALCVVALFGNIIIYAIYKWSGGPLE